MEWWELGTFLKTEEDPEGRLKRCFKLLVLVREATSEPCSNLAAITDM